MRDAEELCRRVVHAYPRRPQPVYLLGVLRMQAGRHAAAARAFSKALTLQPNFAEAYWGRGNALFQLGEPDHAVRDYQRAIKRKPDFSAAHYNLANTLAQLGRFEQAIAAYRRALELEPRSVQALTNLANLLKSQGDTSQAIAYYRRVVDEQPDLPEGHYNLANALCEHGSFEEALASYRRATELSPSFTAAYYNLGNALLAHGHYEEAVTAYRTTLSLDPKHADALINLGHACSVLGNIDPDAAHREHARGVALRQEGRLAEALGALDRALRLQPERSETHHERGIVLQQQGKTTEALAAFDRAAALEPSSAHAQHGRGTVLRSRGQLTEALAAYDEALRLRPDDAAIHSGRGLVLRGQGRLSEALAAYDRALRLNPDLPEAHLNRGNALKDQARFADALAAYREALRLRPNWADAYSNYLFCLNYDPAQDDAALAEAHRLWGAHNPPAPDAFTTYANPRDPERTLRVGLVSADFGRHPVGYFLDRVLADADPGVVRYICYSARPRKDDLTERLQANAHAWRSTIGVPDRDLADLMRADGIDILIDLAGHTAGNRLGCFAFRPAPVQVHWAGYCHSVPCMDYSLWDPVQVPEGDEHRFVEPIIRLPDVRWCYAAPEYAPPVSDPPVLRRERITFGSFNNLTKVNDHVIDLWVRVLDAVPGSRLLLSWRTMTDPHERARIADAFSSRGLDPSRLETRPGPGMHAGVLAEYAEVDIALDTFPFSGCLTTCEALWMGVPVVAWPHSRPASRQSQAFLTAIGRGEWVARDREDYVRIAASLAAVPERLAAVRHEQRARMAASPVCDGPRFARHLEAAFRQIWREWSCRNVG